MKSAMTRYNTQMVLVFAFLLVFALFATIVTYAIGGILLAGFTAMACTTLGVVHGVSHGKSMAEHTDRARVWDEAYGSGVADMFQSMDYDGGRTPPARVNPYRTDRWGLK